MPRVANPERALRVVSVRMPKQAVADLERFALLHGLSRTEAARVLLLKQLAVEGVPRGE